MPTENILSTRYATPETNAIFSEMGKIISDKESSIGNARAQISGVVSDAHYFFGKYPEGTAYEPREIL